MKKHILYFIAIFSIFNSCKPRSEKMEIKGDIKNIFSQKVYLKDFLTRKIIDSSDVTNGKFTFSIENPLKFDPGFAQLVFHDSLQFGHERFMLINNYMRNNHNHKKFGSPYFILEPGNISICGTLTPKDSLFTDSNFVNISDSKETHVLFEMGAGALVSISNPHILTHQEEVNFYEDIVKRHPNSFFLIYIILGRREKYSTKELAMMFNLFDPEVKKSSNGNKLNLFIASQNK